MPLSKMVPQQLPIIHGYLIDAAKILHRISLTCSEVLKDGYSISRQPLFNIEEHLCSGTEKILAHSYCCARLLHKKTLNMLTRYLQKLSRMAATLNIVSITTMSERMLVLVSHMHGAPALKAGRVLCAQNFQPRELP